MDRGPAFIDRSVFEEMLQAAGRVDGTPYKDITTIYGDMSRLVVALLATTPREQLDALYTQLGWRDSANTRAIHEAAKHWMLTYHPTRARELGIAAE